MDNRMASGKVSRLHTGRLLCAALCAALAGAAAGAPAKKALVIMVDGLRADAVENCDMPNVRRLMEGRWQDGYGCAWSLNGSTIRDSTTESAPNHVSIATGVTAAKHGVSNNADLLYGKCLYGCIRGNTLPTWLSRLAAAKPDMKPLYIFAWYGDLVMSPEYTVRFVFDRDEANSRYLAELLPRADAPDATMWYINLPDEKGHANGFYPYSAEYARAAADVDAMVSRALDAIAARPTFADEDWLVVFTADHGGWRRYHGMMSAQSYTIPFLVSRRGVPQGRMAGVPRTCDVATTALAHFGVDFSGMDLDGAAVGGSLAVEPPARQLRDGLAAYFAFDGGSFENGGSAAVTAELQGKASRLVGGGRFGSGVRVSCKVEGAGSVLLGGSESLAFENGREFAVTMWCRTREEQTGDPVALSNKDWSAGRHPGLALIASRGVDLSKTSGYSSSTEGDGKGFVFNCGLEGETRQDVGVYDQEYGEWNFYAATLGADGILRFYQGRSDGKLYCISDDASTAAVATGMPFYIGQDGTGAYTHPFIGDVDDVAIWTRSLSHDEVRSIWEGARNDKALAQLL